MAAAGASAVVRQRAGATLQPRQPKYRNAGRRQIAYAKVSVASVTLSPPRRYQNAARRTNRSSSHCSHVSQRPIASNRLMPAFNRAMPPAARHRFRRPCSTMFDAMLRDAPPMFFTACSQPRQPHGRILQRYASRHHYSFFLICRRSGRKSATIRRGISPIKRARQARC